MLHGEPCANRRASGALAAEEHERYMDPIYYCATGVEFSAFEACKE
jgi:hypothetical protein